jgi:hypothetical protein
MIFNELRRNIKEGIEMENPSSETFISTVVTHELTMLFNLHLSPNNREIMVENSAYHAIVGVSESSVPFHSFAITEALRGVIHGFASAGFDVSDIARHAMRGASRAVHEIEGGSLEAERALRQGLHQSLEDLGMSRLEDDPALDLPGLYVEQSSHMGAVMY